MFAYAEYELGIFRREQLTGTPRLSSLESERGNRGGRRNGLLNTVRLSERRGRRRMRARGSKGPKRLLRRD